MTARSIDDAQARATLGAVAASLGLRRSPLLLSSRRTACPLAVGLGRAAVVLPEGLVASLTPSELRDVLAHEASHIARGDAWIVLLDALAGALYWPVVSVHVMRRELQRASEELCDNAAFAGRDPLAYGETLLRVAGLSVDRGSWRAAVGIFGRQGKLERRIVSLIDPNRDTSTRVSRGTSLGVVLAFLFGGVLLAATRFVAAADEPADKLAPLVAPPVDNDVAREAGHYSGQVTGPDGAPLPGAKVYMARWENGVNHPVGPVRAVTDAEGRFQFDAPDMTYVDIDGLPARRQCILTATAEGFGPEWVTFRGRNEGQRPQQQTDLNLRLVVDDVPIHGRFVDANGAPVAGVKVQLDRLNSVKNDDLDAWLKREVELDLSANGDGYAKTHSRTTSLPVEAVETWTDADGRFTLRGLGRDRLAGLEVSGAGVVPAHLTVMTRESPDVVTRLGGTPYSADRKHNPIIRGSGFTFATVQGRTVEGQVLDRETRRPVAGMQVGLGDWPRGGIYDEPVVTDAEGRFTLKGLPDWYFERENNGNTKRRIVVVSPLGMIYQPSAIDLPTEGPATIECDRGVPFRLRVVDQSGQQVEADVTADTVVPNKVTRQIGNQPSSTSLSRAVRAADGVYEGFVVPGPCAIIVKLPGRTDYLPAFVDPKAFFEPGRIEWKKEEHHYGNRDMINLFGGDVYQDECAAIVLVDVKPDSAPLELAATIAPGRPRRVSLVDAENKPVINVQTHGMRPRQYEPPLRAASFELTRLHPDRTRRITFYEPTRKLVGFLVARGDWDSPYTVRMQNEGVVTGRIVRVDGSPLDNKNIYAMGLVAPPRDSVDASDYADVEMEHNGRFRVSRLAAGVKYTASVGRNWSGRVGFAFKDLILEPGEVLDLGELRVVPLPKP